MSGNTDRCSDNEDIFDDVLTLESWDHDPCPSLARQKYQRPQCSDQVNQKKWDHYPLRSSDQEQNANQTFIQTKKDDEGRKFHDRHRLVEKILDHLARWAQTNHLEGTKPKEDNKKRQSRYWYRYLPTKTYDLEVNLRNFHGFIIYQKQKKN